MGGVCCKGTDVYKYQPEDFFHLQAKTIDGADFEFSQLEKTENKAFLVVNVATNWGLTKKNYLEMQQLLFEYGGNGLKILLFPCNQFLGQEPKPNAEIKKMVMEKYPADWLLFEKSDVNGFFFRK